MLGNEIKPFYAAKADIFSLGVLFFLLKFKKYPFENATMVDANYRMLQCQPSKFWSKGLLMKHLAVSGKPVDPNLIYIISKMLSKSPTLRPASVSEILKHKYFKSEHDLNYSQERLRELLSESD